MFKVQSIYRIQFRIFIRTVTYTCVRAGAIVRWICWVTGGLMLTTGLFTVVPCTVIAAFTVLGIVFTVKDVGVRPVAETVLTDDTLNEG
jgi:hypothetical protein